MKTFRDLISEVAQPKSKDEIDFKAKHEIEMIDHPESEEHQHTSEKRGRKRLADYEKGQDMSVYEAKHDDEDVEENAFMGKAAAAKKAGKDKFKLGDKKFPVTMKKDTAKEILDDDLDESNKDIDAIMSISKIKRDAQKARHGITRKPRESLAAFIARAQKHKSKMQKEEVDLTENFKQGTLTLDDGSRVTVSKQNADLLNQMLSELNPQNRRQMLKVAMEDEDGFNEILGFAREAL